MVTVAEERINYNSMTYDERQEQIKKQEEIEEIERKKKKESHIRGGFK